MRGAILQKINDNMEPHNIWRHLNVKDKNNKA